MAPLSPRKRPWQASGTTAPDSNVEQLLSCESKSKPAVFHSCHDRLPHTWSAPQEDLFRPDNADNGFNRMVTEFDEDTCSWGQHCAAHTQKHGICCTAPLCDFDFGLAVSPPVSNTCLESVCFDFPCTDVSCLEYANSLCDEPGCIGPAETECDEPGCIGPAETECDDPNCEEVIPCAECPPEPCTTCCMADICPHPVHGHHVKPHYPLPVAHVAWHQTHEQMNHYAHPSVCCLDSFDPCLSAALQSPPSSRLECSGAVTDTRSTSASTDRASDTTPRGVHRRLQGAPAQLSDSCFVCRWTTDNVTGGTCGHFSPDARTLHEHIQSTHLAGSASHHHCLWSGCDSGTFNTKPKLSRHLHSHTQHKPHRCGFPGCDLGFVTQQQCDVHMKKHTGEKPFACAECGRAFAYMDLLKSHMRSGVHGRAEKKFPCAVCGERFSDSSNRTKHAKAVHDPASAVPCPDPGCAYVDTRREKLRQHCEAVAHAPSLVASPRHWEDYFLAQQSARRPDHGRKRKRLRRQEVVGVS